MIASTAVPSYQKNRGQEDVRRMHVEAAASRMQRVTGSKDPSLIPVNSVPNIHTQATLPLVVTAQPKKRCISPAEVRHIALIY